MEEKGNNISRNTIYFDESGVASLNDQKPFFILTGVIAKNIEFQDLATYYYRLKLKHFGNEEPIHSQELFWKPTKKEIGFIEELTPYLETLDFGYITVIVDKGALLSSVPTTSPRNPFYTTLSEAKAIWQRSGLSIENFKEKTINEVLDVIKKSKFQDINKQYPLEIAYYTILKKYVTDYVKKKKMDIKEFEICFETSPNRERILRYTEQFFNEKKKGDKKTRTSLAIALKDSIYSISFPNKRAKYLGLELADMISYGYNLSKYKRLNNKEVESYKNIWSVICKKRNALKRDFKIDCVYTIPSK
jgi:hypothetical protein